MGTTAAAEKTAEELRKEIEELNRQRWEITERLRDPRGIRRGGFTGPGPRNFSANPGRQRGFVRPAERNDLEQPPAKRRLSSAIVKGDDEKAAVEAVDAAKNEKKDSAGEPSNGNGAIANQSGRMHTNWSRRDGNQRPSKMDFEVPPAEHVPRVLPKNEDQSLVKRNRRMLGQLLVGTLEKFKQEDKALSGSEAFLRRSTSLQRAEERAREESERLRQQEREQIADKRRRDLTLRARLAAKTEEKKLELLFLRWSEHQRKLGSFLRTKAEPRIYYTFSKPMEDEAELFEQRKEEAFQEWKTARREELSQYQKKMGEDYLANVDREVERLQNPRKNRKQQNNNDNFNLQETMDKELENHMLEHSPKMRNKMMIPGGSNNNEDEEEDVEDINVNEDDMLDDVLGVVDETVKPQTGNDASGGSPHEGK